MNIIELARQAGINAEADTLCRNDGWVEPLETFAKLVVASIDPKSFMSWQEGYAVGAEREREACAKIAEEESTRGLPDEEPKGKHLKMAILQIVCGTVIADAIRARGQA